MYYYSVNILDIFIYMNVNKCCKKYFLDFVYVYIYKIFYMLNLCILVYIVCVFIIYLLNFNVRFVLVIGL